MYILSQVLVVLADGLYVGSMLQKKKFWLTLFLLLSNILFATHYICLGAITGGFLLYLDVVFLIVMLTLEKFNKQKYSIVAVIATMIGTVIITIFTWNGAISLLPMFSMLVYLIGMIFKNIVLVKCGAVLRNLLNIIYMVIITSYIGASLEVCLMISGIVGAVLSFRKNKLKVEGQ